MNSHSFCLKLPSNTTKLYNHQILKSIIGLESNSFLYCLIFIFSTKLKSVISFSFKYESIYDGIFLKGEFSTNSDQYYNAYKEY